MSLTVTGYVNGKPQYRDDGPAFARRQGYGGAAMGTFSGTRLLPSIRSAAEIANQKRRDARRTKPPASQAARKAVAG